MRSKTNEHNSQENRLTVVSLFTGTGGLDIGFHKAGFRLAATVEVNHDCCETARANASKYWPNATIIEGDIRDLDASDVYSGQPDFIIGGPPCQAFSAIGRRAGGAMGTLDPRGNLFEHYCRLLEAFRPKGFLFENVRGIVSSHGGRDWQVILGAFKDLGYPLKYRILDTAAYGVPQHRERIILVGYEQSEFYFPRPTHGPDADPPCNHFSPKEALKGLRVNTSKLFRNNGKYDHLIKDIPPGMNYLFYTKEMGHPSPCFAWRSKFSDFLYKAHPDYPVKTIVARLGRYSGPFHWSGRCLDIKELKRLQGFPDDYLIWGNKNSQLRQIGDSVPPPFAYNLALAVKKTVFGIDNSVELLDDSAALSFDKRKAIKARETRRISRSSNANSSTQLNLFWSGRSSERISSAEVESDKGKTKPIPQKTVMHLEYVSPSIYVCSNTGSESAWKMVQCRNKGHLFVTLCKRTESSQKGDIQIKLSFPEDVLPGIKCLTVKLATVHPRELFVIWDAVDYVIETYTSYPSIHELYGHFTEPKPRFGIEFHCSLHKPWPSEVRFMQYFSNFRSVNQLHPLSLLKDFGFSHYSNAADWVKYMRTMRFDVRSHATNRTISQGMFRCCYPFTLSTKRKSYVTVS